MSTSIEINGVEFTPEPGVDYGFDMVGWIADMQATPPKGETLESYHRGLFRHLFENSLWAITAFIIRIPCAFHPFWIQACKDVQNGPLDKTLDVWARGHGKSTIITCARALQRIILDAEITICIFSYTRGAALKFFHQIKNILEKSEFLLWCYPDIFYANPQDEAPKWSEDGGLFVRRKGFQKEATLYAAGLIEGMPVGGHYKLRIYDDIMVEDMADSPEMIEKLKDRFDLSENLGMEGGWKWVIGTPYHHEDIIVMLMNRKNADGSLHYHVRLKPATEGGEWDGAPVFVSAERLNDLRYNKRKFASQQLLNPTPTEIQSLNPKFLDIVSGPPADLYKFLVIDPAGERKDRPGDCWAIHLVGVEPYRDEIGASDLFLLDSCIEEMTYQAAIQKVVDMYLSGGRILQIGVEKVALSTTEMHIASALRSKGKHISIEDGNLVCLRPAGRRKAERIESALVWPLNNGKIHICNAVPVVYRERLKTEMQRFPYWHDDGLDALSYAYDILKSYHFGPRPTEEPPEKKWLRKWRGPSGPNRWMMV